MRDTIFYLLLGLLFYYILSRLLENYNLEQENFDPALVPVSSLVTLAKIAQKLVNNNTVNYPSNLQIGPPSGSSDLLVTGNTITYNTLQTNGTITSKSEIISRGSVDLKTGVLSVGNTPSGNKFKFIAGGNSGNSVGGYIDNALSLSASGPSTTSGSNKIAEFFGNGDVKINGTISANTTTKETNPTSFGQTIINGGKINIGDSNNTINIDKSTTSGIVINNNNYSLLSATNKPIITFNKLIDKWNLDGQLTISGNTTLSSSSLRAKKNISMLSNTTISNNLVVDGIIKDTVFPYPIDVAGYFKVRAYGCRTPLFYGWNLLVRHSRGIYNYEENLFDTILKIGWGTKITEIDKYINHIALFNAIHYTDTNWCARYLAVKPGFKITLYKAGKVDDQFPIGKLLSTLIKGDSYKYGEQLFDDNTNIIYLIAVQLETESWDLPKIINCSHLFHW